MLQPENLLSAVERFAAENGMSEITFGRKAMNDPHFVRQLREGRRCWPETEGRVRDFMRQQLPALCTICDVRLTDTAIRACSVRDCPNAQRDAA
jgi:tRNA-dihydrouridine synthase